MFLVRVAMWSVSVAWFLPSGSLLAQAPNEFDFDTTQLAVTTIPPNGATHTITTQVTYTDQNLVLNAPLTVRAGAELRLVRSVLKVFGKIVMDEGSHITVIDSSLFLPCQFTSQYELHNEGGLLHTERAVLGSTRVGGVLAHTALVNNRGAWLARHTIAQALICIIGNLRTGHLGNPLFKGGSVSADGLFEGDLADAVHASGMGDVSLANGTMNVGLYYDAGSSTQPAAATLNLDPRSPLNIVYGDPAVHSGVTAPIPLNPCRLELRNHRSVTWQLFAVNASSAGPLQTITLRNAEEIICSFRGIDLTGSPVLGGPWANYYSELPGLPSTERPGHHAMPPGCSVRLGNVVFQSGPAPTDWNRIRLWGLYARGLGTNLNVTGPTAFAEVRLTDGHLQLSGTRSFDMGIVCQTLRLFGPSTLQITNAALGGFGGSGATGLIEANDNSTITIADSRMAAMRLKTTNGAASITAQNLFGTQSPIIDTAGGGVIQVVQATPGQDWDRQNLDFEAPLLAGGVPPFWLAQSVTGSLAADPAPGAGGTASYALVAQAANGSLTKRLSLPAETFVTLIGSAKVVQAPAGGAPLLLQAGNGATVMSGEVDPLQPNVWQRVHVPMLTVGSAPAATFVQFLAGGLPATVRLDGFRVHLGSWWDNDNLANLGFQGLAPTTWTAPDGWRASTVACVADTGNVRPGALPGSRSVRMTLQGAIFGDIRKDLTFLRAGDTVVVTGWVRGVSANSGARAEVIVGNGDTFFVVGLGNNQHSGPLPYDGTWRQFQITYVVPNNPSFTRIDLGSYDVPGTQCWYDDITVSIR